MNKQTFQLIALIITSLVCALVLNTLPLPTWAIWLRPDWSVLVLIYWSAVLPHRISIGISWFFGLLLDILYGSLLGAHALAISTVIYCVQRLYYRLALLPIWRQALIVSLMTLLYQLILLIIQGMLGHLNRPYWFWLSAMTSLIFWPWVLTILSDLQRRVKI